MEWLLGVFPLVSVPPGKCIDNSFNVDRKWCLGVHRMKRISIFLVTVILIVGIVGCEGEGGESYTLTITSTAGGSVVEPGEEVFIYDEGTVVNLTAEADVGYVFNNWTGDVDTIANIHATTTTITMSGNYSIVANFEELSSYNLTISSTGDGSVTTPGQGTFTHYAGTVVTIVASPDDCSASCCGFLDWTGDTEAIANVSAATATVTINDHYAITANFKPFPPEGEPIVCPRPVASGRQTYSVGSGPGNPKITKAVFDPLDVNKCAWQEVTVWANDLEGNPIYQVTGEGRTNSMSFPFTLSLIGGTETDGIWQGYWYNEDEYCSNYQIAINATSASGSRVVALTVQ